MRNSKPILFVEDDSVDTMTVKRALGELKVENTLVCAVDGEEALEYLGDRASKNPCVILLDLNMPRMNGFEFLRIIKADKALKKIPVIVLTTSREKWEVEEGFEFGVAGYMIKPVDYKKFVETIAVINQYWSLSHLPNGS